MPVKQQQYLKDVENELVDASKSKVKYSPVDYFQKNLDKWIVEEPAAVCLKYRPKEDNDFNSIYNEHDVHESNNCTSSSKVRNSATSADLTAEEQLVGECGNFFDENVNNRRQIPSTLSSASTSSSTTLCAAIAFSKSPTASELEEAVRKERKRIQLIRQCIEYLQLECSNSRFSKDNFRKGFLNEEVLSRIFQMFDINQDGYLSQDDWVEVVKERLLDDKQGELAEELESIAYKICGDNKVSVDKFIQIFQAKGIADKVFRLIDKDGDGWVTPEQIMEVISAITNRKVRTGFDKENLQRLEQLFRQTVGNEKEIRRDDFKKILITKNPFFTERVFQIFDKDNSGSISLQEFLDAMHQFAGQTPDDKIKFLFKVYDLDGDGLIQHRELQHVMRACMEENGMRFSEEQIEGLTMALFEDADSESRGAITYVALKNQLEKHEGLLQNLSISIDRWLVPPKLECSSKPLIKKLLSFRPYQLTLPYIRNNYVYLAFLTTFILTNIILFVSRAFQYRNSNVYTILARACGQCLNFNCTFTLILVLRHCITYLRTRGFSSFLPLDHHIYFHKLTGVLIVLYSTIHTAMHLLNFGLVVVNNPVVNKNNYTLAEWLLTNKPGLFGLIGGWANPTGFALVIILLIMLICSQPSVRRSGCFEVFYWTHLLYVPFWILLLIHGPNYWKWFVIPGLGYLLERIIRLSARSSNRGKTYISSGLLLPSKVTHLVMKRPPHFYFHSGDYVFVRIPAIANYEWHPFTISSAPEQEDYMWLHIRGVGGWTNSLYNYFEKEQEKLHGINDLSSTNFVNEVSNDGGNMKRLKANLERTISGGSGNKNINAFKKVNMTGYTNQSYIIMPNEPEVSVSSNTDVTTDDSNKANDGHRSTRDEKYHSFLTGKITLSKSLSMPDFDNRLKKRARLLVLKECKRCESEKNFNENLIRRARLQSLGHNSPQNNSLIQSCRYMRHKPTIIAFKTPSLESCKAKMSTFSVLSTENPNLECSAEEGRSTLINGKGVNNGVTVKSVINYPVGRPLEIFIDGPYGAPSSHIFRAQHAVLIATGIGVTPFASILQSIMHRYWKARHTCPNCKHTWASEIPPSVMHLRKVDFFWINRDQRSFEWFVNLLSQLEIEQAELGGAMERFLEMHMYITSALQRTDMKAVGLQLALDLLHEKEKRDLITGLKTRTNAGRPNWDKVFKQLTDQKKGKVTVFFCGPPQLGRVLRVKCDEFGFVFRKEVF